MVTNRGSGAASVAMILTAIQYVLGDVLGNVSGGVSKDVSGMYLGMYQTCKVSWGKIHHILRRLIAEDVSTLRLVVAPAP